MPDELDILGLRDDLIVSDETQGLDDLEPRCRVCGCTDDNACPGGCIWAAADLCSRCAREEVG